GHDKRVRERFHSYETTILGSQDAPFKIRKIVKLAQFPGFVRIIKMPNEPVRRISEDVLLNRRNLLRGIDEPNIVFRPFLGSSHPDVLEVIFLGWWQDIMRFLYVRKDMRWLLTLAEQIFVSIKNLLNYSVRSSFVNFGIAARLIDNHK